MLIVLSPAKTLDYDSPILPLEPTRPEFGADAARLVARLRELDAPALARLMDLSDALAALNVGRYAAFRARPRAADVRPAVLAFDGDVYDGLGARRLDADALEFAQRRVRILSGLYGVLRPLDAMQPHRLEMGTRLDTERGPDLYAYWGERPARTLRRALKEAGGGALVNLASDEYFRAVDVAALRAPVIRPVFQERRADGWKVISFSAKRARGAMARFAIERRIVDPEDLKAFDAEGWAFDAAASDAGTWTFRREAA
ncbi:MAG TPA: peroxide stress protein YaaA [Burkholderiaceae bacterium]|nr:peroxide stress protein YaaA [Burkholderiaceae bacterium]